MIHIRLATPKDFEKLAGVYMNAFHAAVPDEQWTQNQVTELFKYWHERQPDLFYIAEVDGTLAGGMVANIKPWYDGKRFQDSDLFVSPDFQKQGVGRKLFATTLERAIEKYDVKTFEGITYTHSEFPLSWHNNLGLKKDDNLILITGRCEEVLKNLKDNE